MSALATPTGSCVDAVLVFLIFLPNFSTVSYRVVSYKNELNVHYFNICNNKKMLKTVICRKTNGRKVFAGKL